MTNGILKKLTALLLFLGILLPLCNASAREVTSFNKDWSFARFGPLPDGTELAEPEGLYETAADDSDWRVLNTPHDWGIEGPFNKDLPNRTGKLPWPGIGWYRKSFVSPASDAGQRVFIEFDGAMSCTKVWLNGSYVGEWPYGYSSFRLELTNHLKVGQKNTIAVRLENKSESSRWYPGGGIYRNVRLVKVNPVCVDQWGIFVTTPEVSAKKAAIQIQTKLMGMAAGVTVRHEISEQGSGKVLAKGDGVFCTIKLKKPKLWNLNQPTLYQVKTTVFNGKQAVDSVVNTFGIRTIEYTADGFFLNGKKTIMNGVCQHADLGPLGMAVNTRAYERQIEILKSFGCNAIRTSHNPPEPAFLALCDRMGMLVLVEAFDTWRASKTVNDYSNFFDAWHERDLSAMVRRDRNHPSVVMWSTGNEILEQRRMEDTSIVKMLAGIIRDEDPTRPSTFGCSSAEAATNGFGAAAQVLGINYKPHLYGEIRAKFPDIPLYASETASMIASRGEYFFPVSDVQREGCGGRFQVSSYGNYASPNGYPAMVEFKAQELNPSVFGQFVWTGFDYIGEPTPYNKDKTNLLNYADPEQRARVKAEMAKLGKEIPPRSSYFGIVDLCGFPKDNYYLYQAHWRQDLPMAHILPHWNWAERIGQVTPVYVYTSGDEAELFLNGVSQGRKVKGDYEYRIRWNDVIYQPGTLKVVAYKDGNPWAEDQVETTGEACGIELIADRAAIDADGKDLCFVTVKVVDSQGRMVPRTHNLIEFSLSGPGEIIGIGNGDSTDLTDFQSKERKVFNGLALVIIRSKDRAPGQITLSAASEGLQPVKLPIRTH